MTWLHLEQTSRIPALLMIELGVETKSTRVSRKLFEIQQRFYEKVIRKGRLLVLFPNGERVEFGDGTGGLVGIATPSLFLMLRMWINPEWVIPTSYEAGLWHVNIGTLPELLLLLRRNQPRPEERGWFFKSFEWCRDLKFRFSQKNNPLDSRNNVKKHYDLDEDDLSSDFYLSFLDPGLYYSCAFFKDARETLEEGQRNKVSLTIERLRIDRPEMKVLDIGSGWGGLSREIALRKKANVTGITLSRKQHEWSINNARFISADQGEIQYELVDYREHAKGRVGVYDRIVSVGMFEHAGLARYGVFFDNIRRLLKNDGVALIHTIVRPKPGRTSSWIANRVFPGGYIASLGEIIPCVEAAGLQVEDIYLHEGENYVRTLRYWSNNFVRSRDELTISQDNLRKWEFYFAASEHVFSKEMGFKVVQIIIKG